MKKTFQILTILAVLIQTVIMTSCDRTKDVISEIHPTLSVENCSDLSPTDLDLSKGFLGTIFKNKRASEPEFNLIGHDALFNFSSSVDAGECGGYCAFTVTFDLDDPESIINVNDIAIEGINMSYMGGSIGQDFDLSVADFNWSYPNLEIYVVFSGTLSNYSIDFVGDMSEYLEIEQVVVTAGLCVVENVVGTDTITRVKVLGGGPDL